MKVGPKSSAGFTLVELIVVIGIMGLVLAVVLSSKPKPATARVAVAARAVTATLQLARARAMASNSDVVFRIDPHQGQFGLPGSMHVLPRGMSIAMTIADTERIGESGGLRYYPDGQSSGGEILLMLNGHSSRIVINWLTGEPKLSR
jgi:general secretion pathway protein H